MLIIYQGNLLHLLQHLAKIQPCKEERSFLLTLLLLMVLINHKSWPIGLYTIFSVKILFMEIILKRFSE